MKRASFLREISVEAVNTAELGSSEASESSVLYSEASQADQEKNVPTLYRALPSIKSSSYRYVRSGQGEASSERCNTFRFAIACVQKSRTHRKNTTVKIYKHCKQITCPLCYHSAVGQASRRITDRINKLYAKYRNKGKKPGKAKHIEFDPPKGLFTKENMEADGGKAFYRELDRVQQLAAKDGFYGGVNILHAERKRHLDDSECRDPKCCKLEHKWIPGVHGHYYGYGFFMKSDEFYAKTGWTYKHIADNGPRDCYATVNYQLTHSANFISLASGRAAKGYRYVGVFQDKRARRVRLPSTVEPVLCRSCKAPKHRFAAALDKHGKPVFDKEYGLDEGECHRIIKHEDWKIKPVKQIRKMEIRDFEGVAVPPPSRGTIKLERENPPQPTNSELRIARRRQEGLPDREQWEDDLKLGKLGGYQRR